VQDISLGSQWRGIVLYVAVSIPLILGRSPTRGDHRRRGTCCLAGEEIVVIGKEPWRFKKRAQSFSRRLDAKYIVDPTERPRIPNRLARGRGRAT